MILVLFLSSKKMLTILLVFGGMGRQDYLLSRFTDLYMRLQKGFGFIVSLLTTLTETYSDRIPGRPRITGAWFSEKICLPLNLMAWWEVVWLVLLLYENDLHVKASKKMSLNHNQVKWNDYISFPSNCLNSQIFKFHFKVQLFWLGHKNLSNLPYGFDVY